MTIKHTKKKEQIKIKKNTFIYLREGLRFFQNLTIQK